MASRRGWSLGAIADYLADSEPADLLVVDVVAHEAEGRCGLVRAGLFLLAANGTRHHSRVSVLQINGDHGGHLLRLLRRGCGARSPRGRGGRSGGGEPSRCCEGSPTPAPRRV